MAETIPSAVGKIDATMSGTGFVVDKAAGKIVTCRHIVQGQPRVTFKLPLHGISVECDVMEAPAGKGDWALLTARSPLPASVGELKLHRFRWNRCVVPFAGYGYATLYPKGAGYLHGEVRGLQLGIDLFAEELQGRSATDADGLSGSPCLVGGVAVGIIRAVLQDASGGGATGATLRALTADDLYEESGGAIPVVGAIPLPYEAVFTARLGKLPREELALAAKAVKIDDSGDDTVFRQSVARAMLSGGLEATVKALIQLRSLDELLAKELAVLAESLWVDGLAAEIAATLVKAPVPKGLLWNAREQTSAIDLLRRACSVHLEGQTPIWHKQQACLIVEGTTGERLSKGLVPKLTALFESEFNCKTAAEIKQRLSDDPPIIAVIFHPAPTSDVLPELEERFPNLYVLFMTGSASAPNVADLSVVLPPITAKREQDATEARRKARLQLHSRRELNIIDKDFRR